MATKFYTRSQIIVHWVIVALVAFQYLFHDSIAALWQGRMQGTIPDVPSPDIHVAFGILIFALMLYRFWLLYRHGASDLPEGEPRWARILARATQGLIYLSLIFLPLSGSLAWFFGLETGIVVHGLVKNLLLALIFLHVAGALAQQFWFKSNALMKMLGRA